MKPLRLAAIDLGSNTAKLTVVETTPPNSALHVLAERARITRIGEGLDAHAGPHSAGATLSAEAIDRTFDALASFVELARSLDARPIVCVATAGLRGASNADVLLKRAHAELGLVIEIIDGLREAALAFRAPAATYGPGPLFVLDVGGRSTEIVCGTTDGVTQSVSLKAGGVRDTERFFRQDPPSPHEHQRLMASILETLKDQAPDPIVGAEWVGVSGTIMALKGLELGIDDLARLNQKAEGTTLERETLRALVSDLAKKTKVERLFGSVIPEGRADIIVAGASIVLAVLDHYGVDRLKVSNQGVRFGLLHEHIQTSFGATRDDAP